MSHSIKFYWSDGLTVLPDSPKNPEKLVFTINIKLCHCYNHKSTCSKSIQINKTKNIKGGSRDINKQCDESVNFPYKGITTGCFTLHRGVIVTWTTTQDSQKNSQLTLQKVDLPLNNNFEMTRIFCTLMLKLCKRGSRVAAHAAL